MDVAEAHAKEYLERQGLGPVRFEPDGNCPPDFVLANGTAVEVRRLNQHFEESGESRALEEDAFPLLNGMRKVLAGWQPGDRSWWVDFHFHRPVPLWRELRPRVREILAGVDAANAAPTDRVKVARGFSLKFIESSVPLESRFSLGGFADYNAGGWLMYELQQNIQRCIEEKTQKIASRRARYDKWWLLLLDHIGYAGTQVESELFAKKVRVDLEVWDRVILLDPTNADRATIVTPAA